MGKPRWSREIPTEDGWYPVQRHHGQHLVTYLHADGPSTPHGPCLGIEFWGPRIDFDYEEPLPERPCDGWWLVSIEGRAPRPRYVKNGWVHLHPDESHFDIPEIWSRFIRDQPYYDWPNARRLVEVP